MAILLERLLEAYATSCSSFVFDEIRDECTMEINLSNGDKLQLCDFSRMQFPANQYKRARQLLPVRQGLRMTCKLRPPLSEA